MATPKTKTASATKTVKPAKIEELVAEEAQELSEAEQQREAELMMAELLEDMPSLRAPHRLRLRHKNALKSIGHKHSGTISRYQELRAADEDIDEETAFGLLDLASDMDEYAERIADDPAAYEAWSEANSDRADIFLALMTKYMSALGESNGSAS